MSVRLREMDGQCGLIMIFRLFARVSNERLFGGVGFIKVIAEIKSRCVCVLSVCKHVCVCMCLN